MKTSLNSLFGIEDIINSFFFFFFIESLFYFFVMVGGVQLSSAFKSG